MGEILKARYQERPRAGQKLVVAGAMETSELGFLVTRAEAVWDYMRAGASGRRAAAAGCFFPVRMVRPLRAKRGH